MAKTALVVDDSTTMREMVSYSLKEQGKAAGATGWLEKPLNAGMLLTVVAKVVA